MLELFQRCKSWYACRRCQSYSRDTRAGMPEEHGGDIELFQRCQIWYAQVAFRSQSCFRDARFLLCQSSMQEIQNYARDARVCMPKEYAGDISYFRMLELIRQRSMQEIQNHSKDARVCTLKEYAGDISYSRTDMPQMLELICPRSCQSYSRDARVGMPKEHAGVRVILEMLELVCQKSMIYLICLRA